MKLCVLGVAIVSTHHMNTHQIHAISLVHSCKSQAVTEAFWETGCDHPSGEVYIQEHIYIQMHLRTLTHMYIIFRSVKGLLL